MLDVEKVVVELAGSSLDLGDVALIDLCPAGDPRAHDVAIGVERNLARVPGRERQGFRPGADPAHLALQDVDDLRELIEPVAAQEASDTGDSQIVLDGEVRTLLRLRPHRAEFEHREDATAKADSTLAKEERSGAVDPDRERDHAG